MSDDRKISKAKTANNNKCVKEVKVTNKFKDMILKAHEAKKKKL